MSLSAQDAKAACADGCRYSTATLPTGVLRLSGAASPVQEELIVPS